ncbi:MAG: hypothetical protein IT380_06805 [Myxococcales bacterium]|nr:hypothetical protein [Myxococcales bacterium]
MMLRLAVAVTVVVVNSACATVFTGTRQDIAVTSTPPGATVVVLGGTPANLALRAQKVAELREPVLALLGPHLPEPVRAALQEMDVDELVTKLVLLTRVSELPPELAASAGGLLSAIPGPIVDKLTELLGIEGTGVSPTKFELKKGKPYAVVLWAKGYGAKLLKVDTTFNWVTLVNVLNAFLGVIVDGVTGAWFNLTPEEVGSTLSPLPTPPPAAPAPAAP